MSRFIIKEVKDCESCPCHIVLGPDSRCRLAGKFIYRLKVFPFECPLPPDRVIMVEVNSCNECPCQRELGTQISHCQLVDKIIPNPLYVDKSFPDLCPLPSAEPGSGYLDKIS